MDLAWAGEVVSLVGRFANWVAHTGTVVKDRNDAAMEVTRAAGGAP